MAERGSEVSKMTTEQFLSHLGIEVGDEVMIDEYTEVWIVKEANITTSINGVIQDKNYVLEWGEFTLPVSFLIGKNYFTLPRCRPLPKYTLTEDEKAYVRSSSSKFIKRNIGGQLLNQENAELFIKSNLFRFVECGGIVSLDELRKCL